MKLIDSKILILASKSPRRKDLLEQLGLKIRIHPSHVNEKDITIDQPDIFAGHLAYLKAQKTGIKFPEEYVLGADTIVVAENRILGKPESPDHAMQMLMMLNNTLHQVYTGFCIYNKSLDISTTRVVKTDVVFKNCSKKELQWYIDTGEPFDKAGAYGVQGIGAFMVASIRGSYSNVVGLPVCEVVQELEHLEILNI